jgi:hypothetical protein
MPNLDYDVRFIPVVTVADPGRCCRTGIPPQPRDCRGSSSSQSQTRPAAAGDHCSRRGTDTYDGSCSGEEKVSCAPDGLCSM